MVYFFSTAEISLPSLPSKSLAFDSNPDVCDLSSILAQHKKLDLNVCPVHEVAKANLPSVSSSTTTLYKLHAPASLTRNMVKEKMKLFSPPSYPNKALEAASLQLPEEP